jgi:ferredoxin
MRIHIDAGTCAGHGRCYELSPALFTDDEYGYGQVVSGEIGPEQLADARRAVTACPEQAISLGEGRAG